MSHTEQMREALEKIAAWDSHDPMLGVNRGSNGVRDFYRQIAQAALTAPAAEVPEEMGDEPELPSPAFGLLGVDDNTGAWVSVRNGGEAAFDDHQLRTYAKQYAQWQSTRLRGGVPEGWKLMPVEPTQDMLDVWPTKRDAKWDEIQDAYQAMLTAAPQAPALDAGVVRPLGCIKPDTDTHVYFYEQDCYVLSNFSAFRVAFDGQTFDTSEAAYHYQRFTTADDRRGVQYANSAHEAFRYAQDNKAKQRPDWDAVKVDTMRDILRAKAQQHEYVRRKLLATGDRILVEDSWRDDFWGWGPNRNGQNVLGKLWMEVRSELRAAMSAQGGA